MKNVPSYLVRYKADRLDWINNTLALVEAVALENRTFTTDDIWPYVLSIPEPRIMGAVMVAASKAGYCVPTDRTIKSDRVECHSRPVRVWRSNLA